MTDVAIRDVVEGEIVDRDTLLDSIAEYARWLQQAEQLVQAKSLEKAADLAALYREGSWVAEWQEIEPSKPDPFGEIHPASYQRFTAWLEHAERQRDNPSLSLTRVKELLRAHDIVSVLPATSVGGPSARGVTVRAIQPLEWLRTAKFEDQIPKVWSRAVELAEEREEKVERRHVLEARSEFQSTLTPELQRQAINTPRAQTLRAKAQVIVQDLWATGNTTECKKFYDWFAEFLRVQQEAA